MDLGLLDQACGYLLRRALRDVERRFAFHFRSVGLTAAQYAILVLIDRNPGCAPGDVVAPMGISQNNLVGIIGDLIRRDLVLKETDPADRRARVLTLTDEGRDTLAMAHAAQAANNQEFLDRFGSDKMEELVQLLRMFDRG